MCCPLFHARCGRETTPTSRREGTPPSPHGAINSRNNMVSTNAVNGKYMFAATLFSKETPQKNSSLEKKIGLSKVCNNVTWSTLSRAHRGCLMCLLKSMFCVRPRRFHCLNGDIFCAWGADFNVTCLRRNKRGKTMFHEVLCFIVCLLNKLSQKV